jgi:hypothetical protein
VLDIARPHLYDLRIRPSPAFAGGRRPIQ